MIKKIINYIIIYINLKLSTLCDLNINVFPISIFFFLCFKNHKILMCINLSFYIFLDILNNFFSHLSPEYSKHAILIFLFLLLLRLNLLLILIFIFDISFYFFFLFIVFSLFFIIFFLLNSRYYIFIINFNSFLNRFFKINFFYFLL